MPWLWWRRFAQLCGAWTVVGLALAAGGRQETSLECTCLSVGHGASVLLRTPEGHSLLYDAGRLASPAVGARNISGALWSQGIMRLDAVIISHADIDHYNALPELLSQFQVDVIYVSPLMFREDTEPLRVLRAAIQDSGAALCQISAGDELRFGDATRLHVLHPPAAGVSGSDNAQSIVLAVEHAGRRVLLPGDLEAPGTQTLLMQPPVDCDVLLAPHHGSLRSHPSGFSDWCRPEWVVISGGAADDKSGKVAGAYQARGAQVLHTAHDGAVRFTLSKESVTTSHWNHNSWQEVPASRTVGDLTLTE